MTPPLNLHSPRSLGSTDPAPGYEAPGGLGSGRRPVHFAWENIDAGDRLMKPELHPDAAKNFNGKARALQDIVGPMTEALPSELPTHIARPGAPAHVVSEGKLFDFKITGMQDQFGRTTARYFEHQGRRFGLEGDRYKELAQLSQQVAA